MSADSSKMRERIRLPQVLSIGPYLRDHHVEGKIVLPAVEILQWLAGSAQSYRSDLPVTCMRSASFDRFLTIERDAPVIEAVHELDIYDSGRISAKLITVGLIKGTHVTRTKIHAAVNFMNPGECAGQPIKEMSERDGTTYILPSHKLYSDLVPFGPSYQNVQGNVYLSERGASAQVHGADHSAPSVPLGSPFPFDGALHVACAWGQWFHHIVAFPVGFEKRLIVKPTAPGEMYFCRILPAAVTGTSFQFDIWIHDAAGGLREEIRGVLMRDVFGGRVKPPDWILYRPPSRPGL